jgi:tetrahydromethanopterin S-methyltransferase subunit G
MKAMRSTWTDSRLDDFKDRVDSRFGELSRQVGELSGRVDKLRHVMTQGFIAIMVAMFTGFVSLAGLIITQV